MSKREPATPIVDAYLERDLQGFVNWIKLARQLEAHARALAEAEDGDEHSRAVAAWRAFCKDKEHGNG